MNNPEMNWDDGTRPKREPRSRPMRIAANVLTVTIHVALTALVIIGIVKLTLIAFF